MRLTKMIYLASAYTAKPESDSAEDKNTAKLKEMIRYHHTVKLQAALQDRYPYAFIGPILMSGMTATYMKTGDGKFKRWARIDYTYISRCDEIWVYQDEEDAWKTSVGVQAEIKFAKKKEIPIKYIIYNPNEVNYAPTVSSKPFSNVTVDTCQE